MKYYSLNRKAPNTTFEDAVVRGLAPDKGLYFPEKISPLPNSFFETIDDKSNTETALETLKQFIGDEIEGPDLKTIIEDTLCFDFPIIEFNESISTLELFHGPTMAFKDVGGRFMARCLGHFNKNNSRNVTVLVATSGDTGGAVANGFLGVKGVDVVILYPSGKVSDIQEKQLTTLGQNITALEVDGVFDDCQDMVKQAFVDEELTSKMQLTSANSINVARWLPQLLYFFYAYKQLKHKSKKLVFSVPSGNFGNICAGMVAQKLGLPIKHFIASNNANNVVTNYLRTQTYNPKASVQTISNAMDVGNPSNFIRIEELHNRNFENLKKNLSSYSFTDTETRAALLEIYTKYNYVADPHGAVGYLGALKHIEKHPNDHVVFLETAHPTKFLDVVEDVIRTKVELPEQIKAVIDKKKKAIKASSYSDLKRFLLNR
ncbi:threonine synthase [Winogradskyella sp. PC-19]|uniref:threonine synthase n=1 Tax=unclassified Winogradskyella TaxID=2615021 RepID=UPI000B3C69EF|nr:MULTISPECIES: threonine synthase [unclassified Winogradskyella]ARV08435.1 threonine synthase [Winogradskyella sp. PC-19]